MSLKSISHSLALRIVVFYARNPEEELTFADTLEKFDAEGSNARHTLKRCIESGMVERCGQGRDATYRAGVNLLRMFSSSIGREISNENLQLLAQACMPVPRSDFARSGMGELTTC